MEKAQTGWKILTLITIYLTNLVLKMGLGNLYLFKVHLLFHNIASSGNLMFYYFSESLFSFKVGLFFRNPIIKCMQTKRYRSSLVILIEFSSFITFQLVEEGKVNPEVMTSEANEGFLDNQGENGESKEKAGPADKRGHLRICVRRSGSRYVPYPCFRSGWTIHSVTIHTVIFAIILFSPSC